MKNLASYVLPNVSCIHLAHRFDAIRKQSLIVRNNQPNINSPYLPETTIVGCPPSSSPRFVPLPVIV